MIGLSRTTVTAGGNSLGALVRQTVASDTLVNTFNWPSGKTRAQLEGDIPLSALADPAKSFRLVLMAFISGSWREWCSTTFTGAANAASLPGYPVEVQPVLRTSSVPPNGVPCEMRVIPVTGTLDTGVIVRGL